MSMKAHFTSALILSGALVGSPALSALTPSFQVQGHVAGQLVADSSQTGGFNGAYTFSLSGMPASSVVLKAYLYGSAFAAQGSANATFAGTNFGAPTNTGSDGGFTWYRWDVTGFVTVNGVHAAQLNIVGQLYGAALGVIYNDPSLPLGDVAISDGGIELSEVFQLEQGQTIFNGFAANPGKLSVFTVGDDNSSSNERLDFNSATVGGPFDGNLGSAASLVHANVTTTGGAEVVDMYANGDHMAWQVAMLQSAVPEPASLIALAFGFGALARRKAR
ncbi:MAG: PEP-CTERM sorting domain-containing protein [Fimbriimonadaceae bacterium]|nr:MAG: PEP-CTERM sorting domain-containing protein [Armatimonadota bacterium]MCK6631137.1 PEP-CTERM sorting domain-containing protein [Fimbriimonadaceae bacterium]NUM37592.1 PEP-CTERM sorting domain-containing protein [Armatimonadota bacterium]WKZ81542.1 MAG: PEP-CTERM sorting domain-containing protein [Fimbriimonadaceae bacterium]HQU17852.1 PEP-CTERM sorting domain-containing protein [Fimbriimonadaceae bacterium]